MFVDEADDMDLDFRKALLFHIKLLQIQVEKILFPCLFFLLHYHCS